MTFGRVVALRELNLQLEPGRIYGLLGPNGSGKTTTLATMLGVIEPDEGRVELLGAPPDDIGRARVGFVPQYSGLPHTSRVEDLLVFIARLRGFGRDDARCEARTWIDRLQLPGRALINDLSAGQQRKVQVSVALLCEPDLIVMDEPLTWLDPQHQERVVAWVREAAAGGATVVLATHRLREAEAMIEHVVMLHRGDKVLDSPMEQALEDAFENAWRIRISGDASWVEGPEVVSIEAVERDLHVRLAPDASVAALFGRAAAAGAQPRGIEALVPSLHDLYLTHARRHDQTAKRAVA